MFAHKPMKKAMAPYSSTLAWKIPWTEGPGGLQSMGSLGAGHDWATSLSLFTSMHWEGNGNPLQCSCLENPRDGGAWWAAVYGVAQSRIRLKRLSIAQAYESKLFFKIYILPWYPKIHRYSFTKTLSLLTNYTKKKKKRCLITNCKNLRVDIASQHHIREGNYCAEV